MSHIHNTHPIPYRSVRFPTASHHQPDSILILTKDIDLSLSPSGLYSMVNSCLSHPSSLVYSPRCLASSSRLTKVCLGASSLRTRAYSSTRGAAWEARHKASWFSTLHCQVSDLQMWFSCPCWSLPVNLCGEASQQGVCPNTTA